ncbi:MAG: TolC family protein [Bacteriovoracaceae bacterium]
MKYLIFFLIPLSGFASNIPNQRLIELAMERTPLLQSFGHKIDASTSDLKQSRILANPILTIQSGSLYSGNQKGAVTDITLNQPFPWPGRRDARIKNSEYYLKLSQLDLEEAKLSMAHRVFNLCAEVAALEELEKHRAERKRRFSLIHKFLTTRPMASPRQTVERDLMESQIKIIEKMMLEISVRKNSAYKELSILTGEEVRKVEFNWTDIAPLRPYEYFQEQKISGPRIRKIDITKSISENQVEAARLEARPDILLGVNYRQEQVAPANHFYHAQISFVLPIIDHGQHTVQSARANLRKTEALKKVELNSVETELYQAYASLDAAYKSSQLFPVSKLNEVEKNFDRAEVAFRKGQIDAMLFLQADTQIHEIIDQIFLSRLNYFAELSRMKMLIGKGPEL